MTHKILYNVILESRTKRMWRHRREYIWADKLIYYHNNDSNNIPNSSQFQRLCESKWAYDNIVS